MQPLAGGVWPDLSQHGNDGTVSGTVSGAGDHVVFGNGYVAPPGLSMSGMIAASGGTGAYTVAAWFQYTGSDTQTYSAIFGGKEVGSAGTEWFIGKNAGNTALGVQDGGYDKRFVSSPGVFDAAGRGSAHSLIYTRSERQSDGKYTGKAYIDGVLAATGQFTGVNGAEQLLIGKEIQGAGFPFTGRMWQALVSSKALSASEALQLHGTFAAGDNYCASPSPSTSSLLPGILVGDRQIQIGANWRIAAMDDDHLVIGHRNGNTPQIFRSTGTLHPGHFAGGPHGADGWNPFVGRPELGEPNGVTVGDHAIQFGTTWRIARIDATHLSIGHSGGQTVQIFRSTGTLHPGPRTDFNPFSRALGEPSGVTSTEYYLQIGGVRIGVNDNPDQTNPAIQGAHHQNHLSVGYGSATSVGMTCVVYRSDGTVHPGPRKYQDLWGR